MGAAEMMLDVAHMGASLRGVAFAEKGGCLLIDVLMPGEGEELH